MKNYLQKRNGNEFGFFDNVFDDFFMPSFYDMGVKNMRTDIKTTDDGYKFEIEMPGLSKEDISVSYENGYLNVKAAKKETEKDEKENYVRRERSFSFSRSFYVGKIDEEKITANYKDGVLNVSVPSEKKEITTKKINVE